MTHARHNFYKPTIRNLAQRSGYLCAYKNCCQLTIGPSSENAESTTNIGVACHIHAASPGGKRYKADQTEAERRGIENGIWMCQVHAKLIDDDEVTYPPDLLIRWKQEAEKVAADWVKKGKHPWAQPPAQIAPFLRLEDWVASRWGRTIPESTQIFPTLEEFEGQKVYLSQQHAQPVRRHLQAGRLALVKGAGCCGKSVFGVALALAWQRDENGTCLWLDLRDEAEEVQQLKSVLREFARWREGPLLLVVDNAHLNEDLVQWLRDELTGRSLALPHCHVLLLARPVAGYVAGRRNVMEQLALQSVDLTATPLAFAGVAGRLFARKKKDPLWLEQEFETWVKSFGGDLIAFGQAVASVLAKGGRGKPDTEDVLVYIRQRYLLVARKARAGEASFLRMCAMASLDLDSSARGLDGAFDMLYPELAQDGLAMEMARGGYAFWQFQHAGLGELVLQAAAKEQGESLQSIRQRLLLEYVTKYPYFLRHVIYRLSHPEYATEAEYKAFKDALDPGLVEDAFVQNLGWYRFLCNLLALNPNWEDLLARRKPEVLVRLGQLQPQYVVTFLKHVGEARGEGLLRELLAGGYGKVLGQTPPLHVVTFLNHVGKDRGEGLLSELLDGDYVQELSQAPPGDVVTFLKHVGEARGEGLLRELLEGDYRKVLGQSPPDDVVTFLKHAGEARGEGLLRELLDSDYSKVLERSAPEHVSGFLKHVGKERGEGLLSVLFEGDYGKVLGQSPPGDVVTFLKHVGKERGEGLLIELLEGDFVQVLAQSSPYSVTRFLTYVGKERGEGLLDELLAGDYGKVLAQSSPEHVTIFLEYAGKKHEKVLFRKLLEGDYGKVLAQSSPEHVTTFLKHVGKERGEAFLSEFLDSDYAKVLSQSSPHNVARFLKHVGNACGEGLPIQLLDGGYGQVLANADNIRVTPIFKLMLGNKRSCEKALPIFRTWLETLLSKPLPMKSSPPNDLRELVYFFARSQYARYQAWLLANKR